MGNFHFEDKARSLINRSLLACGRLIQSKAEMNLGAGFGVAQREFQMPSGCVDYGLFVSRPKTTLDRFRNVAKALGEERQ